MPKRTDPLLSAAEFQKGCAERTRLLGISAENAARAMRVFVDACNMNLEIFKTKERKK